MLGKFVKVRVTSPMNSFNKRCGYKYKLNYGIIESGKTQKNTVQGAYIMGISHPVRNFDGRVIACIKRFYGKGIVWVVAPKSMRFINNEVIEAVSFAEREGNYNLECLYENSCGSIVFTNTDQGRKYLLIRNKRSAHWGFPKGHVEKGETNEETAKREVLEETGIEISIIPGFAESSEYTIQGRIEKNVVIFLSYSNKMHYKMQEEEIEECGWFGYEQAMRTLNYENDKRILVNAENFIKTKGL